MSYAGTLAIHDADSHILETPTMLLVFADPDSDPCGREGVARSIRLS